MSELHTIVRVLELSPDEDITRKGEELAREIRARRWGISDVMYIMYGNTPRLRVMYIFWV